MPVHVLALLQASRSEGRQVPSLNRSSAPWQGLHHWHAHSPSCVPAAPAGAGRAPASAPARGALPPRPAPPGRAARGRAAGGARGAPRRGPGRCRARAAAARPTSPGRGGWAGGRVGAHPCRWYVSCTFWVGRAPCCLLLCLARVGGRVQNPSGEGAGAAAHLAAQRAHRAGEDFLGLLHRRWGRPDRLLGRLCGLRGSRLCFFQRVQCGLQDGVCGLSSVSGQRSKTVWAASVLGRIMGAGSGAARGRAPDIVFHPLIPPPRPSVQQIAQGTVPTTPVSSAPHSEPAAAPPCPAAAQTTGSMQPGQNERARSMQAKVRRPRLQGPPPLLPALAIAAGRAVQGTEPAAAPPKWGPGASAPSRAPHPPPPLPHPPLVLMYCCMSALLPAPRPTPAGRSASWKRSCARPAAEGWRPPAAETSSRMRSGKPGGWAGPALPCAAVAGAEHVRSTQPCAA